MLSINDVQQALNFAIECISVLTFFHFLTLLVLGYPSWAQQKAVKGSAVEKKEDKKEIKASVQSKPVMPRSDAQSLVQSSQPNKKQRKVAQEQPKKKTAKGKKEKSVREHASLNGCKVQIYQLRGQPVVMVDDLPFSIPQTAQTYQLRGKLVVTLLIAQEIANQPTAAKEVKLAA